MFCKSCQTEKDESEFYVSDKHHCKACKREQSKNNRLKNAEYYKEYDRNRPNKKERVQMCKLYKDRLRKDNPEKYDEVYHGIRKRYRKNHAEENKAQNKLNEALRAGKIVRPNKCVVCQKECKPQAHHYDYSKPLDVMWLCVRCHANVHKNERLRERKGLE